MNRLLQLTFAILTVVFFLGCGSKYEASEEIILPPEGWARSDTLKVRWDAKDTTARYDILMDMVHARDYPFQNIYLEIETNFPSGKTVRDLVNVNMMDKSGYLYGLCGSERCELRVWLQRGVLLGETGEYALNIYQHTRQDTLPGIYSAAFRLKKHESKPE